MTNELASLQSAKKALEQAHAAFVQAGEHSLAFSCSDLIQDAHEALYGKLRSVQQARQIEKLEAELRTIDGAMASLIR